MRIAVGFAFELGFHRPRPRDCLAVITARIQVGDGKSALYFLRRITGNPFLVFGLAGGERERVSTRKGERRGREMRREE